MELVADILLVAGALGAGLYCFVLARRLNRFNDLEKGVGGAVAVLSAQVDDLNKTLQSARAASDSSNEALSDLTTKAEAAAQRLELLMASMHDVPINDIPEPDVSLARTAQNPDEITKPGTTEAECKTEAPAPGLMFMRRDRSAAKANT
ncbi:hypothetical protein TRL7639_03587 [Falsiruegeria litorea R37]|uniref:Uncharacterized protein n=1 Tax=Falsiruegeria litorea R37 TaxID=1200284 RepID=A0A1Y5TGR3_9RHOB|nr:hypothetical protein [Falsiruegeria litorea]SLN63650.1 hypothetical protein TRL7639_03587 [Falsiruegeria litorea R37]